jgi:hypothetical protein
MLALQNVWQIIRLLVVDHDAATLQSRACIGIVSDDQ